MIACEFIGHFTRHSQQVCLDATLLARMRQTTGFSAGRNEAKGSVRPDASRATNYSFLSCRCSLVSVSRRDVGCHCRREYENCSFGARTSRHSQENRIQDIQVLDTLTIQSQAQIVANSIGVQPGRPQRIADPDVVQLLLASLADGNYRETACAVAGMSKQSFYQTLKRADAGDDAAIAFRDAVENAEASAEAELVGCVRSAAKKGPQYWAAGMTFLERKSPDKWGRRAEENNAPRVVVQIGAGVSDVTVNVVSAAPSSSDLTSLIQSPIDVTPEPAVYAVSNGYELSTSHKARAESAKKRSPGVRRGKRTGDPAGGKG